VNITINAPNADAQEVVKIARREIRSHDAETRYAPAR